MIYDSYNQAIKELTYEVLEAVVSFDEDYHVRRNTVLSVNKNSADNCFYKHIVTPAPK